MTSIPLEKPSIASRRPTALAFGWLLLIVAIALIARSPGFSNEFVNYDDPEIRAEVASKSPIEFFTGATYYAYVPLYGLSLWIDHHLFGESPVGPHVVNGLLFALAAGLVALVLHGMLRRPFVAVGAALLLAVHPVHTENVARSRRGRTRCRSSSCCLRTSPTDSEGPPHPTGCHGSPRCCCCWAGGPKARSGRMRA